MMEFNQEELSSATIKAQLILENAAEKFKNLPKNIQSIIYNQFETLYKNPKKSYYWLLGLTSIIKDNNLLSNEDYNIMLKQFDIAFYAGINGYTHFLHKIREIYINADNVNKNIKELYEFFDN